MGIFAQHVEDAIGELADAVGEIEGEDSGRYFAQVDPVRFLKLVTKMIRETTGERESLYRALQNFVEMVEDRSKVSPVWIPRIVAIGVLNWLELALRGENLDPKRVKK